jgi:hypothetical protein
MIRLHAIVNLYIYLIVKCRKIKLCIEKKNRSRNASYLQNRNGKFSVGPASTSTVVLSICSAVLSMFDLGVL